LLVFSFCLLHSLFPLYAFQTIPHTRSSLCWCITINNRVSYLTSVSCYHVEFRIHPFLGYVYAASLATSILRLFHSRAILFSSGAVVSSIRFFWICTLYVLGCIHLFVL
jgi:hypothetical protein